MRTSRNNKINGPNQQYINIGNESLGTAQLFAPSRPKTRTYQNMELEYQKLRLELSMARLNEKVAKDELKRLKTNIKRTINISLTAVMVICLCVCGVGCYDLYNKYTATHLPEKVVKETIAKTEGKKYLTLNWENILKEYPSCVGWVYLPNTGISFPIMHHATDGNYCLTHSAEGNAETTGAIFIDSNQKTDFTEENTIIYGHSVEYVGGMFTDIEKFADKKFFNENPEFFILTPQNTYKVNIRAFAETTDGSCWYTIDSKGELAETLQKQKNSAKYFRDTDTEGKPIVTLSTCKLQTAGGEKFVLQGVLEYYMGDIEVLEN